MAGPSRPAAVPFILLTVLLDVLGIGIIIPVAPRLVASFLHDDLSAASHYLGFLLALYSIMQFVFAPVLGGLSDHFGRRSIILLSLLGASVSYLFSAFAPTLGWLFIGRAVAGITGASFSAAGAYVADVTPPEKRAASFGAIGAMFGLGFILGPAVGGLLGQYGLRVPYMVSAGLNMLNLIYGLFVLPESLPRENRRPFSWARANAFGALKALARHPIVLGLTGTLFFGFLAQMILQSVWALSNQARFDWSIRQVGFSLMAVGLGAALVQGLLIRRWMPRLGERRALVVGLVMSVFGYIGLGFATRGWMIYACIVPLALAGLAGPATQAIISREVGPKEQGELQGSLNSLQGLAAIIGPLVGTSLLARFAPVDAAVRIPGAPFLAASLCNLIGLLLALRIFARTQPSLVAPASE